jgi:hypothetical protein
MAVLKNIRRMLAVNIFIFMSFPANATINSFEVVPTAIRMQDYLDGAVDLYFTPSTCGSGLVALGASAPTDSKNRLWSLILTAKTTGKKVGIYYDSTTCFITNFYAVEG